MLVWKDTAMMMVNLCSLRLSLRSSLENCQNQTTIELASTIMTYTKFQKGKFMILWPCSKAGNK